MITPIKPATTPAIRRATQFFLAGCRHHDDGEQRRRGVQDRGQPACDIGLSHHDQRERQHVVEKPDREKRLPARHACRETDPVKPQQRQQDDQRRERHAQEHHRQRRQFPQYQAVEEERTAPQDREQAEQRPVPGVNPIVVGGHYGSYLRLHADLFRARRAFPPDSRTFATRLFRPRHDLDHLAFVVIGRVGLCRGRRPAPRRGRPTVRLTAGSRPTPRHRPHPCAAARR